MARCQLFNKPKVEKEEEEEKKRRGREGRVGGDERQGSSDNGGFKSLIIHR